MASSNFVLLTGNTGKAAEIFTFPDGTKKATFSLATTEKWKNKDKEPQEKTDWHTIVFTGHVVQVIEKYVEKGTQLQVAGKLSYRSYDDKDGVKKYITEIIGRDLTLLGNSKGTLPVDNGNDEPSVNSSESDDLPF